MRKEVLIALILVTVLGCNQHSLETSSVIVIKPDIYSNIDMGVYNTENNKSINIPIQENTSQSGNPESKEKDEESTHTNDNIFTGSHKEQEQMLDSNPDLRETFPQQDNLNEQAEEKSKEKPPQDQPLYPNTYPNPTPETNINKSPKAPEETNPPTDTSPINITQTPLGNNQYYEEDTSPDIDNYPPELEGADIDHKNNPIDNNVPIDHTEGQSDAPDPTTDQIQPAIDLVEIYQSEEGKINNDNIDDKNQTHQKQNDTQFDIIEDPEIQSDNLGTNTEQEITIDGTLNILSNMYSSATSYSRSLANTISSSLYNIGSKVKENASLFSISLAETYKDVNERYMQYRLPDQVDLKNFKKNDIRRMMKTIDKIYNVKKAEGVVDKVYNLAAYLYGSNTDEQQEDNILPADDIEEGAVMHWFEEGGVVELQNGNIEICFRGTHTYTDIYQDIKGKTTESTHTGFKQKYDLLKNQIFEIISNIQNKNNISVQGRREQNIKISGHSMGGALAKILALDLYEKGYNNLDVFTIGSPEPFSLDKKNEYLKYLGTNTLDITTTNEFVSNLGAGGFWPNNQNSIVIPSTSWCPHSLTTYDSSLDYLFKHKPDID